MLVTTSPADFAASVSILLKPTPNCPRIFARFGFASTAASTWSVTVGQTASYSSKAARRSPALIASSVSFSVTSKRERNSNSTLSGHLRVQITRGLVILVPHCQTRAGAALPCGRRASVGRIP